MVTGITYVTKRLGSVSLPAVPTCHSTSGVLVWVAEEAEREAEARERFAGEALAPPTLCPFVDHLFCSTGSIPAST